MCRIEFKTDNADYRLTNDRDGDDEGIDLMAVADTVSLIANKIGAGYRNGPVMDVNGNKVGTWEITD